VRAGVGSEGCGERYRGSILLKGRRVGGVRDREGTGRVAIVSGALLDQCEVQSGRTGSLTVQL
jgi:hypothetical protein